MTYDEKPVTNVQLDELLREIDEEAKKHGGVSWALCRKIDKLVNLDRENFGEIIKTRLSKDAQQLVCTRFKWLRGPKKISVKRKKTKPGISRVNLFAAEMKIDYNIRSGAQLSMTLEEAGLTPRLRKILHKRRIFTLEDLSLRTREEVASFERMTPERAEEAERTLSAYGLTFNRHIEEMSPEELEVLYPGIRYARKEAEERLEFERAIRDAILGSFGDM
ncbi:MAG: hypothetical protein J6332_07830 [Abditibacteriota bacterium]|nr:hypothetical protein [Abditibacteriota bacterium]